MRFTWEEQQEIVRRILEDELTGPGSFDVDISPAADRYHSP